jgi:mercuric ion transport protein
MLDKDDKKPIKVGLLAGFVASLCCVGPLILIILGIGGASTALAVGKQSPYFLALGVLILAVGLGRHYFRDRQEDCGECELAPISKERRLVIIILSGLVFVAVYYVLLYVLVPYLAPVVYRNFYN